MTGNCQRGETGTLLCPGAQCETDSKDAHHEEKRVGFRPCQREFDEKQNRERDAEENTVIPSEADRAVARARTEIDRNRADYTDCVKSREGSSFDVNPPSASWMTRARKSIE